MVHFSVLIGSDIFAALKIEAQQDRDPGVARPKDFALSMVFLNFHINPP
jgi:hypothetical protein